MQPSPCTETGQTVPFVFESFDLSMKPRKVELLQMQEQGCVLLPPRPMHGDRSTFGGNFGRGSLSDIEKFRAKLPRELVVQRERGEEKFLVRRRFDLV